MRSASGGCLFYTHVGQGSIPSANRAADLYLRLVRILRQSDNERVGISLLERHLTLHQIRHSVADNFNQRPA